MKETVRKLRRNRLLQGASLFLAGIFPVATWFYLVGNGDMDAADFCWVGLYSCLLVCLVFRSMVAKVGAISINLVSFFVLISLVTLSGLHAMPEMILRTFFPMADLWLQAG